MRQRVMNQIGPNLTPDQLLYAYLRQDYVKLTKRNDFNQVVKEQMDLCELPDRPAYWLSQALYVVECARANKEYDGALQMYSVNEFCTVAADPRF